MLWFLFEVIEWNIYFSAKQNIPLHHVYNTVKKYKVLQKETLQRTKGQQQRIAVRTTYTSVV